MLRTAAPSCPSGKEETSSSRKSTSRPSRCNNASSCTARSSASDSGGSVLDFSAAAGALAAAVSGVSAVELDRACNISCGIFPRNNSEKKQRNANDSRAEKPIITAPKAELTPITQNAGSILKRVLLNVLVMQLNPATTHRPPACVLCSLLLEAAGLGALNGYIVDC